MPLDWKEHFTVGNAVAVIAAVAACATAFGTQKAKIDDLERRVIALEKKVETPVASVDPILKNRRRLSPPVRGRNGSCYGAAGRVAADGLLEA